MSEKLTLSKSEAEKTVKLISETDFLKETFKGVGKIGTKVIKDDAVSLFGEAEGDAFARHLRVAMHVGVQAITDHIADMSDAELIATWTAYDVEFTNEEAYTKALSTAFKAFEDLVEPIGKHVETTQYGSSGGDTKAVWLNMYGKRRLAVVDFPWAPKGLGTEHWRRFKGWVPDELVPYTTAKSKRTYGDIEEIDPQEPRQRAARPRRPAETGARPHRRRASAPAAGSRV